MEILKNILLWAGSHHKITCITWKNQKNVLFCRNIIYEDTVYIGVLLKNICIVFVLLKLLFWFSAMLQGCFLALFYLYMLGGV